MLITFTRDRCFFVVGSFTRFFFTIGLLFTFFFDCWCGIILSYDLLIGTSDFFLLSFLLLQVSISRLHIISCHWSLLLDFRYLCCLLVWHIGRIIFRFRYLVLSDSIGHLCCRGHHGWAGGLAIIFFTIFRLWRGLFLSKKTFETCLDLSSCCNNIRIGQININYFFLWFFLLLRLFLFYLDRGFLLRKKILKATLYFPCSSNHLWIVQVNVNFFIFGLLWLFLLWCWRYLYSLCWFSRRDNSLL